MVTKVALASLLMAVGISAAFAQNNAVTEAQNTERAATGTFKTATGTCQAAYFKSGPKLKSVRGEDAITTVIVNSGVTVNAVLILAGARQGQIVNPMNDQAIMLFEPLEGNQIRVHPLGGPAAGWPVADLSKC